MPVLNEEGLVGKTTTVAQHYSIVVLVADETCGVCGSRRGDSANRASSAANAATTAAGACPPSD